MEKENGNLKYNEIWIAQRADPYVLKAPSGCYYFTASVPAYDSVVLRRADTLAGLVDAEEIVVWRKHESGPMSLHVWAPEIHYLFGKWYIYFAAGDKDDIWEIRPYVLECQGPDPMKDEWVELGKMRTMIFLSRPFHWMPPYSNTGVSAIVYGRKRQVWANRFPTCISPRWKRQTN